MNIDICMYNQNTFNMNYMVFYPDNYENLPLVVYLHGAGERGKNIKHLYRHGIPKLIQEGKDIPAVILCPQCPDWCVWDNVVESVKGIIDIVVKEFSIKKDRICITGASMGGFGTWMMAKTYNNFFAAMAPVAGGGMSWRASNLKTTPILAVHGDKDTAVPITYSELMVNAVNCSGGKAELIVLNDMEHNDGIDFAYKNTKLMDWLLSQRRSSFEKIPEFCSELF